VSSTLCSPEILEWIASFSPWFEEDAIFLPVALLSKESI